VVFFFLRSERIRGVERRSIARNGGADAPRSPPAFHAPINPAPPGRSTWRAALIDLGAIRRYGDWQRLGFFRNRLRRMKMQTSNERPKSAQVVSGVSPKNSQVKHGPVFRRNLLCRKILRRKRQNIGGRTPLSIGRQRRSLYQP